MSASAKDSESSSQLLQILSRDEQEALFGRPRFSHDERALFFDLSPEEKVCVDELNTTRSKIAFILQLGYFKARHLLFSLDTEVSSKDIRHISQRYFSEEKQPNCRIGKNTRLKHQKLIIQLCGYKTCDKDVRFKLQVKAQEAAKVSGKPIYVFRQVLRFLDGNRWVSPAYSSLQILVGKALTHEQKRMESMLKKELAPNDIQQLNGLLEDSSGLHQITRLKHDPKNFTLTELRTEVVRGEKIKELYLRSKSFLSIINISNESIRYYASLVEYYTVFRLKRFDVWTVYLFLLCFIHHRYRRYCDNLLACFIYHVRKYSDETKEVGKDRVYQEKMEMHQNMPKIGSILKLFTQDTIEDDESFRYVRGRAYAILPKEKLDQVANHIASQILFDEKLFQWEHIDALRFQFKKYLRPVLSAIEFRGLSGQQDLLKGVDFLKDVIEKERPIGNYPMHKIPVTFISPGHHRYLMAGRKQEKQILPNRYEFHLCRQLCNCLESGDIYCSDSIRFRSFEDDLVNSSIWKKYKPDLIEQAGLPLLKLPVEEHLDILEDEYETLIRGINMRIDAEKNSGIKIKTKNGNLSWHLTYPKQEDETNHPFFNAIEQVDIGSVLEFVDTQCRFTEAFTHVLGRYTKSKGYDKSLMASIIAWGTNTGLGKMGQISDISYNSLKTTSDNFIRLETLRDANDCIVNAIKKLPITQEYNLDGLIHSSSDGQKFETAWPTINARHSPKYFGLKKGIVAFALTANNIALNADVIGANEHESHYVFDIIHNNTSDIDPDIHSTDTHGTNQVNFAILNMFGYQFAPRYKNFPAKVTSSLVGFQPIESYNGLIKPARQISKTRIIKNWDMIQRIMVSLALKSATQSIIVGKLNAYSRKNDIRNALWEYDAIFGSLYFLRYIDDPILRKHVETALNRGENYNKLRKAVAFSNFGRLRFKNEQEQKLWQECCRLITNCIIYYNATILSEVKIYKERVGDVEGLSQLRKISLVAWQHINLQGRYKFKTSRELIKMSRIIQQIMAVM